MLVERAAELLVGSVVAYLDPIGNFETSFFARVLHHADELAGKPLVFERLVQPSVEHDRDVAVGGDSSAGSGFALQQHVARAEGLARYLEALAAVQPCHLVESPLIQRCRYLLELGSAALAQCLEITFDADGDKGALVGFYRDLLDVELVWDQLRRGADVLPNQWVSVGDGECF